MSAFFNKNLFWLLGFIVIAEKSVAFTVECKNAGTIVHREGSVFEIGPISIGEKGLVKRKKIITHVPTFKYEATIERESIVADFCNCQQKYSVSQAINLSATLGRGFEAPFQIADYVGTYVGLNTVQLDRLNQERCRALNLTLKQRGLMDNLFNQGLIVDDFLRLKNTFKSKYDCLNSVKYYQDVKRHFGDEWKILADQKQLKALILPIEAPEYCKNKCETKKPSGLDWCKLTGLQ